MSKSGWRTFKICKKKKLYVYHVKYTSSVWTLSDKLFIDINKANYWQRRILSSPSNIISC